MLRRRVGEHASRLKKLEAGLKTHLESIQQMQVEEARLSVSVARLSKEKSTALSCLGPGIADGVKGYVEEGGGTGNADSGAGEERLMALVRENRERTAELEREKERLQARCRELQVKVEYCRKRCNLRVRQVERRMCVLESLFPTFAALALCCDLRDSLLRSVVETDKHRFLVQIL